MYHKISFHLFLLFKNIKTTLSSHYPKDGREICVLACKLISGLLIPDSEDKGRPNCYLKHISQVHLYSWPQTASLSMAEQLGLPPPQSLPLS
jgi:hypothetical protein